MGPGRDRTYALRDAYWSYVFNTFTFENNSSDPDSPKHEAGSFVKSLKNNDAFTIASLRENGTLKIDAKDKNSICYRQFQSAFTRKSVSDIPQRG